LKFEVRPMFGANSPLLVEPIFPKASPGWNGWLMFGVCCLM
jgi:hypothetical protein